MSQRLRSVSVLTACVVVALGAGCGLKGPLTLPERASNVVIRGPSGEVVDGSATPGASEAASGTGAADSGAATPTPPADSAAPVTPPRPSTTKKPATDLDRMPPPPLPGGNPGSPGG